MQSIFVLNCVQNRESEKGITRITVFTAFCVVFLMFFVLFATEPMNDVLRQKSIA
jgi:hypothetical protein